MATPLRLSVLDVSPIPSGSTAGEALSNTVDLARHAEALGLARHWLAEHHNSAGLASSTPEVLIGHVAAATSTITVGAGGIMLPNHSPLKVAETFRVLEALHPGRIDLGLGRAPGTDPRTALALRRSRQALAVDDFPDQLSELVGYLDDDLDPDHPFGSRHPHGPVRATPVGVDPPSLWVLGSSGYGGIVAAQRGMGFAFAHHINPELAVEALLAYRARFRPSGRRPGPHAILALSVVCAETDDEAEELAGTVDLAWLRIAQGRHGPLPSPAEARAHEWAPQEEALRRANRARHVVGGPERVAAVVGELAAAARADEVMALTMVHDHGARLRSYELLAAALGGGSDLGRETTGARPRGAGTGSLAEGSAQG